AGVCVSISELGNAIFLDREELIKTELSAGIVGHVGDGNFHVLVMINMQDPDEIRLADTFNETLVMDALNKGGTCRGEHGVGVGKQKYQQQEHGEAYKLMKQLRRTMDTNNILKHEKLNRID